MALDTSVRDAPRRLLEHRRHLVREFAAGGVESPGFFRSEFRSWYQNRNITSFLKPLITSSALVFDIGANQGVWTKAFRDRDATVVAVEPQATCCLALEREFSGDRRVRIVSKAVGSQEGEAVLYSDFPGMEQASMAPDWMDDLRGAQVMPAHAWGGAGKLVPVTTLDALIAAFGRPEYCKIDVEGSEPEVLGGLSQAIPALSFEFHRASLSNVRRCMDRLISLGTYRFKYGLGEWLGFEHAQWLTGDQLANKVEFELPQSAWGNIFAVQVDR